MEIPAKSWIPRTKRNRWAWGFAWASLAVFLFWNLMPYYHYNHKAESWTRRGLVMMDFWPEILGDMMRMSHRSMDVENALFFVVVMALLLMSLTQLVIAPLGRIFAASRLLRYIPAGMYAIGLCCLLYFLLPRLPHMPESRHFTDFVLWLIALNFLLSLIALLLYHPEPELIPES